MKKINLICTNCKKIFDINEAVFRCDKCNEPLEVELISSGKINEGTSIFERYSEFLPFDNIDDFHSLGEGLTPLVKLNNLSKKLEIKSLFIKNESNNPTWSFKDRGTAVGIVHALKLGYKKIGTVSTGNMASSVAAYGSSNNLETYIFVKSDMPEEKIGPIAIYHPNLLKIKGNYGSLYYESLRIGKEHGIYFINSDVPMRVEGSKTIAFEISEQLDFSMPDYIIVPTSAGGNVRGIEKGFRELKASGIIEIIPKIIVAQASGCSPIANAYELNSDIIKSLESFETIAHAIENPNPPSGNQVLRMIKRNGGTIVSVTDEEIISAQGILAKEGLFGQPASAVPIAAIIKLRKQNYLNENDSIVCVFTGSGLKYTAAFKLHKLEDIEINEDEIRGYISGIK